MLVEGMVQEGDDPSFGSRARFAQFDHLGHNVDRVAMKKGHGKPDFIPAEIGDRCAQRQDPSI